MSRKRRHINARNDEWIVVHRKPGKGGGAGENPLGCLIIIIVVAFLLNSC